MTSKHINFDFSRAVAVGSDCSIEIQERSFYKLPTSKYNDTKPAKSVFLNKVRYIKNKMEIFSRNCTPRKVITRIVMSSS